MLHAACVALRRLSSHGFYSWSSLEPMGLERDPPEKDPCVPFLEIAAVSLEVV